MAKTFSGLGTTAGLSSDRTSMTGMVSGQLFFETDTSRSYVYDGSIWRVMGNITGTSAQRSSFTGMLTGQQFFETDTKLLWYYDGSAWQRVHPAGSVVQTVWLRYDTNAAYTANASGSVMSGLSITITPRYATSKILLQWMINGEPSGGAVYNMVFRVGKDGSVMTNPGGYNTWNGNYNYSGIAVIDAYDGDYNSTPNNISILFMDDGTLSTASRTYAPIVCKSNTSDADGTYYINRSTGGTGQGFESGVCTGFAMEIMQ